MPLRIRSYTRFLDYGQRRTNNTASTLLNLYQNDNLEKVVADEVLPGDSHYFAAQERKHSGNRINGVTSGSAGRRYVNMIPDDYRLFDDYVCRHLIDDARPSDAILVAKLLANTNPNRADVDIPTFIGELKDIPALFKGEAGIIKRLAGTNLKYQFGIKPLVRDVFKLLDFTDLVVKREQEFKALEQSGLARVRTLYKNTLTGSRVDLTHNRDKFQIYTTSDITTKYIIRGHVKWSLVDGFEKMSAGDLRNLARKAALGLTVDINTAYQLMPWSWLIDWCSNLGDILANTRNIIPVQSDKIFIMEHIESSAITSYADPRVTPGTWYNKTKDRTPYSGNVFDSQLPHLSLRQMSILGSIGVTRRLPRSSL